MDLVEGCWPCGVEMVAAGRGNTLQGQGNSGRVKRVLEEASQFKKEKPWPRKWKRKTDLS